MSVTRKVSWTPEWKILPKPYDLSAKEQGSKSVEVDAVALWEVSREKDVGRLL